MMAQAAEGKAALVSIVVVQLLHSERLAVSSDAELVALGVHDCSLNVNHTCSGGGDRPAESCWELRELVSSRRTCDVYSQRYHDAQQPCNHWHAYWFLSLPLSLSLLFLLESVISESTLRGAPAVASDSVIAEEVAPLSKSKPTPKPKDSPSEDEIWGALNEWADGLISIRRAYKNGEDYTAVATRVIRQSYNYDEGLVLFKPTLSAEIPFRTTFEGALSYFVAGNPAAFPEDTGFALSPWKSVAFNLIGVIYLENRAIIQTKTTLTKEDGSPVVVHFSMSWTRSSKKSKLKLDLHHSSVPYASHYDFN